MGEPKVGVVIPTHNRRVLLSETLSSVLTSQDVDLEVVVIDDGSADGTSDWLATVDDARLRFVTLLTSGRAAAARNVGLEQIQAPLVMTLDDDDLLRPGSLSRLIDVLERQPTCAAAAGTYETFGGGPPHRPPHPRVAVRTSIWREELFGWNAPPGTSVWRTEVVRAAGGWDASLSRCEDLEFNLRLGRHRVALIPDVVLRYRVHGGQADGALRARDLELDRDIRAGFLAGLPQRDRRVAEQILRARATFPDALAAYEADDHRLAARRFARLLRAAPSLARSPIVGPWLLGLLGKSLAGLVLPGAVPRLARRAGRALRAGDQATDPAR